jgi:hypothetical protein
VQPTQKPAPGAELTPADILRLAALYLRRHGWTRDGYYVESITMEPIATPGACALGAIGMATYGAPVSDPFDRGNVDADVFRYTAEVLRDHLELNVFGLPENLGHPYTTVSTWNDNYAASADEVIHTLEAAAKEWDFYHDAHTAADAAAEHTSGGAE